MNEFQQVFLRWLDINQSDLSVRPRFDCFVSETLHFTFGGFWPNLVLRVSPFWIRVSVYKRQFDVHNEWDSLLFLESCQLQYCCDDGGEYPTCHCVRSGHPRKPYEQSHSAEKILAEHCFDRLKEWIESDLNESYWLLYGEIDEHTYASLQAKGDECPSDTDTSSYNRIAIREHRPKSRTNLTSQLIEGREKVFGI